MLIGDICSRYVVSVGLGESIPNVVKLMRDQHVGSVVVIDDNDPVGIVTDRDIVIEVLAAGVDIDSVIVSDIMSADLLVASENDSIHETLSLMQKRGVRRVPVVDSIGTLVSVLAVDDLIEYFAARLMDVSILFTNEYWKEEQSRP